MTCGREIFVGKFVRTLLKEKEVTLLRDVLATCKDVSLYRADSLKSFPGAVLFLNFLLFPPVIFAKYLLWYPRIGQTNDFNAANKDKEIITLTYEGGLKSSRNHR